MSAFYALALPKLFERTRTELLLTRPECSSVFGWRRPTQQRNDPARICWVPGDPVGDAGVLGQPSKNPRGPLVSLASFEEQFTLYVQDRAREIGADYDELANYSATRMLFDDWLRAMTLAAYAIGTGGRVSVVKLTWLREKKEAALGATLRVQCALDAMIPRESLATAPANAEANVTGQLLDVSETQHVTKNSTE